METNKVCVQCGGEFETKRYKNQKLCSTECRNEFHGRFGLKGIATGTTGSISEMMVACHMLAQGYSVFRTVSPHSFCDVVAIKGNESFYIEVRTGYKSSTGAVRFQKKLHDKIATPTHYGVYIPRKNEVHIFKIDEWILEKYSSK